MKKSDMTDIKRVKRYYKTELKKLRKEIDTKDARITALEDEIKALRRKNEKVRDVPAKPEKKAEKVEIESEMSPREKARQNALKRLQEMKRENSN